MSSGNKLKVADQKFIFCQVCFYFRPFSLFQRNMKNKMNLCSRSTGVQRSKNQVLPVIICFRFREEKRRNELKSNKLLWIFCLFQIWWPACGGPRTSGGQTLVWWTSIRIFQGTSCYNCRDRNCTKSATTCRAKIPANFVTVVTAGLISPQIWFKMHRLKPFFQFNHSRAAVVQS